MCTRAFIFALLSAVSLVTGFASSSYANEPKSLVFLFQKQKDPLALRSEAEAMAQALSKHIGMPVTAQVPGDYAASVQALVSGTADVAYVDSMSYLLAERDAGARILLAETRTDANGVLGTSYDSLFVVPKGSKITSLENLK
jgi:phosphonate transport system substrate-binding protein